MPILQYLFGVGGALLCLMFVLNAYVPAAPLREHHEIDKSIIHVTAARTGDFVVDHFPTVRGDLADTASDSVRNAMAMMPSEDLGQAARYTGHADSLQNSAPHKRRVVQRTRSHLASSDVPSPPAPAQIQGNQASPNNGSTNNNRSQGWSNNSSNWDSHWSQGWGANRWADNH